MVHSDLCSTTVRHRVRPLDPLVLPSFNSCKFGLLFFSHFEAWACRSYAVGNAIQVPIKGKRAFNV